MYRNLFKCGKIVTNIFLQIVQMMADVMFNKKEYKDAIYHYQKLLEVRPDYYEVSSDLPRPIWWLFQPYPCCNHITSNDKKFMANGFTSLFLFWDTNLYNGKNDPIYRQVLW